MGVEVLSHFSQVMKGFPETHVALTFVIASIASTAV
jgi:hypothetical protein